jgi:hypothetical protein
VARAPRGAANRQHPPRVSRLGRGAQRAASALDPQGVLLPLPPLALPPALGDGLP